MSNPEEGSLHLRTMGDDIIVILAIGNFQMRSSLDVVTRCLSLRLPYPPHITPQRGGADTAADCAHHSGALQAPIRPCNCRQLAATWHRASGESRCRTRTCFAFEPAWGADTDRRERVCVVMAP